MMDYLLTGEPAYVTGGALVFGVLLLMHHAGRRGWVRGAADCLGRMVKYGLLRRPRRVR